MIKVNVIFCILFFILMSSNIYSQTVIGGHWEGAISIMGSELGIMVDFKSDADTLSATIDIPVQHAIGLKLRNVSFLNPKIYFELPAGPGLAVFDGAFKDDSISGDFTQAGMKGKFHLKKGTITKVVEPPEPPPPYNQEEVEIKNGNITLGGTLTLPETKAPCPAVILITGSGAQNRDEEIFGFKPFKLIADHLTKNGIAVLRCDDRGVGKSSGSMKDVTGADFAQDVEAMVKFLSGGTEIDKKKIGLLGHSEGGLIAPMVAEKIKEIAFIILVAGPGVSGDKLILRQIEFLAKEGGATNEQIQQALKLQNQTYQTIRTGKGWDELKAEMRKEALDSYNRATPEEKKNIPNIDTLINAGIEAKIKAAQSPWFKYFIDFDPSKVLEKVKCPVLALFGELDMQVPRDLNEQPLENALKKAKNKKVTIRVLPKANHLFQEAKTGSPSEYGTLKKEFVPGFLNLISGWIKDQIIAK